MDKIAEIICNECYLKLGCQHLEHQTICGQTERVSKAILALIEQEQKPMVEALMSTKQALEDIHDIAIDYDGYRSEKDLKKLIDELRELAKKRLLGNYHTEVFKDKPELLKALRDADMAWHKEQASKAVKELLDKIEEIGDFPHDWNENGHSRDCRMCKLVKEIGWKPAHIKAMAEGKE